ncbi:MAG: hypothetical protein E7262_04330 [Lachnospiraceae bacterium]|nr:hypothetical protein [Lachnospiraceae bacterium]
MSSKGKLYSKHLEQAKYVVKGRKLSNNIAIVKRKDTSSNVVLSYGALSNRGMSQYSEETQYSEEAQYSEESNACESFEFEEIDNTLDFEWSESDIDTNDLAIIKEHIVEEAAETIEDVVNVTEVTASSPVNDTKMIEVAAKGVENETKLIEEVSEVVENESKVTEELSKVTEELSKVMKNESMITDQVVKVKEEIPQTISNSDKAMEEAAKVMEDRDKEMEEAAQTMQNEADVIENTTVAVLALKQDKMTQNVKKVDTNTHKIEKDKTELTKEQVDAKVLELKEKEEKYKKEVEKDKDAFYQATKNLVSEEERSRGIINEKKENVSKDQLDELERIRLLELARVKKETLEKERIEKARAKKEEKLQEEEKQKEREERKNIQLLEEKKKIKEKRKKARKTESKSFAVVAALLALIIVAGMANIGNIMYNEIQKENTLVGEMDKKDDTKKTSLLDSLYSNITNNTKTDTTIENEKADSATEKPEVSNKPEKLDTVEDGEIVVADRTSTKPENKTAPSIKQNGNNIEDSLEDLRVPILDDQVPTHPSIGGGFGEETGSDKQVTPKFVEIQYSGNGFELYKTTKSNVTKSVIIAGGCREYKKYTKVGGVIKIPEADADGLWFIVKDGKIEAEFAFTGSNEHGVASLVLMKEKDGAEVEDDIIYAKQGSTVTLDGTYCTRDDEGNEFAKYENSIVNVIGKMVLYKKN